MDKTPKKEKTPASLIMRKKSPAVDTAGLYGIMALISNFSQLWPPTGLISGPQSFPWQMK